MITRFKTWVKDKWKCFKKWLLAICLLPVAFAASEIMEEQAKNEVSLEKTTFKYQESVDIKSKYKLEGTVLTKADIKNAELDKYKQEPKDKIEVVLGDKSSQEFKPDIELKRWDEVSFKLKPKGLEAVATKDKDITFEGDKIQFTTPKMNFEMFDVPATANDEGGYKYVWYLNEKPTTNKVEFDIETQNLDYFYQPPLDEENIDPIYTCTETQCKDADGTVVMERAENVVGSYAVYHKTKGGMNDINGKDYKVGKAFHIYRPHIIDTEGKEIWGKLHIEDGIYSIEIPQEFLDKAVYPIKSNDTFGWTTNGATSGVWQDTYNASGLAGVYPRTASAGDTIISFHVYGKEDGGEGIAKMAAYSFVSSHLDIRVDVAESIDLTTTAGWRSSNEVSQILTGRVAYTVAFGEATDNITTYYYDSGTLNAEIHNADNVLPADWTYQATTNTLSMYATYTKAPPPPSVPPTFQINSGTLKIDSGKLIIN